MRMQPGAQIQLFEIQGRFDGATVADVRPRLYAAIELGSGDLVVDLSEVETIDVIGLGVLVGARRAAARAGRRMVLRAVPPWMVRMLATMGLHRVLAVEPARAPVLGESVAA